MKLYDSQMAPNPRRVRIFLAEKGIEVPTVQVDLGKAEQRSAEFVENINQMGRVPVLELDDGTHIAESVAICRYFEEIQPEPPLFGVDPLDKATVEMWNRRMELSLLMPVAQGFRHTHEFFAKLEEQVPEWGEQNQRTAVKQFAWLDGVLADRDYVAGERYSIADISALCGVDFAKVIGLRIADDQKNLARWYEAVAGRASAKA
ncbi:MAG: glutathione S-transferase [Alphaproteobacteria bacterium]|jgi:glutathione S-transferase|nr:glutathione S-transferase [Alphaproteobacteria bacterium]MDP6568161.1 glutathione S-transferase [Alphaproteobacteria bacterium]